MKKIALFVVCGLMVSIVSAQTGPRLTLTKPMSLNYAQPIPSWRTISIFEPIRLDTAPRWSQRPDAQIELRFNDRYDPFRTWNHRRVGFREAFGGSFRSERMTFEISSGSTSEGRMSNVGFEIRW